MTFRQLSVLALLSLAVVGCKKRPPATGPTSAPVSAEDPAERARADSVARAEAIRMERVRADSIAREQARVREALSEMVFFDYDSFDLTPESEDRLRSKAELLRANPSLQLRVEGHADQRGSTEYNLVLGQKRAEVVRDFLQAYGISADRLATLSYGKERPLVDGEGEELWARNRRAEFTVLGGTR